MTQIIYAIIGCYIGHCLSEIKESSPGDFVPVVCGLITLAVVIWDGVR